MSIQDNKGIKKNLKKAKCIESNQAGFFSVIIYLQRKVETE